MTDLTLHPPSSSGKIQVTRMGGSPDPARQRPVHFCWLDPPGTWFDDRWNVHYDGCDRAFPTKDAALGFISGLAGGATFAESDIPLDPIAVILGRPDWRAARNAVKPKKRKPWTSSEQTMRSTSL